MESKALRRVSALSDDCCDCELHPVGLSVSETIRVVMMKFNPRCMTTDTQMAINNRNQLMPCCLVDTPFLVEDPAIKKLLSVSNISEHKSLEEILSKKEWIEFYDILKEAYDKQTTEKLPEPCIKACLDCGKEKIRKEEWQT